MTNIVFDDDYINEKRQGFFDDIASVSYVFAGTEEVDAEFRKSMNTDGSIKLEFDITGKDQEWEHTGDITDILIKNASGKVIAKAEVNINRKQNEIIPFVCRFNLFPVRLNENQTGSYDSQEVI